MVLSLSAVQRVTDTGTFIDDATRFLVIVLLHNKSEAFLAFKRYKAYVENLEP